MEPGEMAKSLFYDFSEKSHVKKNRNGYESSPDWACEPDRKIGDRWESGGLGKIANFVRFTSSS
jgi:hypothetical protein